MMREHNQTWPESPVTISYDYFAHQDLQKKDASDRINDAISLGISTQHGIKTHAKTSHETIKKYANNPFVPKRWDVLVDESVGYLMGLLAGDGGYSEKVMNAGRVGFTSADHQIAESFIKIVSEKFDAETYHGTRYDYWVNDPRLRQFIVTSGMGPKYSFEKSIPDAIWKSPKSVAVAFIQGLLDTDGMVSQIGRPSYCTTSAKLARDVQGLMLAIGVRSSRVFHANDFKGAWLIYPKIEDGFAQKIGFRLMRKQFLLKLKSEKKFRRTLTSYPPSMLKTLQSLHNNRSERGVGTLKRKVHKRVINCVFRKNVALSKDRISNMDEVLKLSGVPEFESFWMGGKIWWNRVKSAELTESELVDISVPETENFIGNGFINHNTVGALAVVCDHAWNTDRANITIVSVSQSVGLDSGIWEDLISEILPKYMAIGQGMRWIKKPFIAASTKKPALEVTNRHGTKSKIQLESLKFEHEVEERFKGKRYSMMYVPELSNFKKRKTFDIWAESLRMLHLKESEHLFLADTNPADEGEDSWIFHVWYLIRKMDYNEYSEFSKEHGWPVLPERSFLVFRDTLGLLEFTIDDNIFATQDRIDELIARYSHDQDLFNRYIKGMWVKATSDAIFASVFRPNIHIIGEVQTVGNPDPLILVPEESTWELLTGWDPGSSSNSAAVIIEKVIHKNERGRVEPWFKILDELVIVDTEHGIDEFTQRFVEKMHWWEERMGRNFSWKHWSDRSVFDMKEPRENRYYHQLIHAASGGEITLTAADRGPGSIKQRVDLFKRLLFENRVYFSADKCKDGTTMCRSMRRGKSEFATIQKGSQHKHVFDAITYCIASECYNELGDVVFNMLKQARRKESGDEGVISVKA